MIRFKLDIVSVWAIQGWAYDTDHLDDSLKIDVSINGHLIEQITANILRVGLKNMGHHPSGKAGFRFYIGDKITVHDGDQVKISCGDITLHDNVLDIKAKRLVDRNESVLIVGQGKSGTSKLTYVVSSGMPSGVEVNFEPTGRHGLSDLQLHKSLVKKGLVVTKSLYESKQTVRFGALSRMYDRKIWILRDPRDRTISLLLYRWFKGHKPNPKKYQQVLELVQQKEKDPKSVNVTDIWDVIYAPGMYRKKLIEEYTKLGHVMSNLDNTWFILPYEYLVDGQLQELDGYLGFKTSIEGEVPEKFSRVVRSKAYGNWRNWFTPADVEYYREAIGGFIDKYCPHVNDWQTHEIQALEPTKGSMYMQTLFEGNKK